MTKSRKKKSCRDCEYYDDGTGIKRTAKTGDCHNTYSPRFTPESDYCCEHFYLNTSLTEDILWHRIKRLKQRESY